jgi:hypothetical protein
MKEGMNWITPTLVVSVSKVADKERFVGTILKKEGSFLYPVYWGYDITKEMVQKYV